MQLLEASFLEQIKRTDTVRSFRFALPEKTEFLPGQFLQVIFDPPHPDDRRMNKYLSFSSSPTKDYIEVTKRLSNSLFSQRLLGLKSADKVILQLPMGNCIFKEEYRRIGFLIGGIGITPVISIIDYIVDKNLNTDTSLFYSNRTEEEIAFKKELDYWQAINKNIHIYYTVTDCQPRDKVCHYGRIDRKLLEEKACDTSERIFFIFGPPKMVEAMHNLALELSCKKENIKIENFLGY